MRIVILGTGALGCVFAARLAPCAEVIMLGTWAEGIAAVRRDGVCLRERDDTRRCVHIQATTDPAEVSPADVALLLVKSYQTERAAAWAARVLKPDGLAITLQNGLDNGPKLIAAVGPRRSAVGVTYNGAILLGPGEARHTVRLPTHIGATSETAERVAAVAALFTGCDLETHVVGPARSEIARPAFPGADLNDSQTMGIEPLLWAKALANVAINPLTALWRIPNGGPLETADRRSLLAALVEEAAAVARARGIVLPCADPVAYVEGVCRATAVNRSSMLQDVERGRPTEIDSLNGVIVAEGRRLAVPTPVNEVVWRLARGTTDRNG